MPVLPVGPAAPTALAPSPRPFGEVLRARMAAGPEAPGPAAPGAPGAAARFLGAVERARARLDTVLAEARRGRTFAAGELLALQVEAYRGAQRKPGGRPGTATRERRAPRREPRPRSRSSPAHE